MKMTANVFPQTVCLLLWIRHRRHCQQFSLELLPTDETVPMITVDKVFVDYLKQWFSTFLAGNPSKSAYEYESEYIIRT